MKDVQYLSTSKESLCLTPRRTYRNLMHGLLDGSQPIRFNAPALDQDRVPHTSKLGSHSNARGGANYVGEQSQSIESTTSSLASSAF
ncbi:hypothetical protein FA13DRAFT_1739655 [Coprinellus micaceus]|uniref:Uncharacterized protein n=1 Tax=Coprinellus micaceus TaxID=71717 RepID=A0A4Y7SPX5_COPMI|nr:hypothetical protein FA13DRAFT_1739655 [Coprinellus micaceus]